MTLTSTERDRIRMTAIDQAKADKAMRRQMPMPILPFTPLGRALDAAMRILRTRSAA